MPLVSVADPKDFEADLDPSFQFDEEQEPESETLRCGSKIPLLTFMRIRIRLFTLMRIRILLLIKVMKICYHLSTGPPRLHF